MAGQPPEAPGLLAELAVPASSSSNSEKNQMATINAQIVTSGVVTNSIVVDSSAALSAGGTVLTFTGGSLTAPTGSTFMLQAGAGIDWTLVNGVLIAPAAPVPPTPTQAQLQASLVTEASAACANITGQIYTDPAHEAAGQNAGVMAALAGGAPTSSSPFFAAFNAYAAAWGLAPAAFATLVVVLMNQSLALSTALNALEAASEAATTAAQLATALSTFEPAIGAVVSAINAAGTPFPMTAPAAISIQGINA
jgi:hypothetical protein